MKSTTILLIACFVLQVHAVDHNGIRNVRNLINEERYDAAADVCQKLVDKAKDAKEKQYYVQMAIRIAFKDNNENMAEKLLHLLDDPMRRNFLFMKFFPPEQVIAKTAKLDLSAMPKDIISDAYALRGAALLKAKNNEQALEDLKRSLDLAGGTMNGISAKYIGDFYLSENNEKAAEEYYKKAIATTPGAYSWRCETIVKISQILTKKGKADEALNLYSEDLLERANRVNKAVLYSSKAKILLALDKKSEALDAIETAVKNADGKHRQALQNLLNKLAEDML